jgi:hypothetical protein
MGLKQMVRFGLLHPSTPGASMIYLTSPLPAQIESSVVMQRSTMPWHPWKEKKIINVAWSCAP